MIKGLAAGYEAKNLEMEKVRLGDLRRGEWRELSAEEIAKLKAL